MNYRKTKAEVNQITHDIVLLEDNVLSIDLVSTIEADLKCHAQEKRGFFQFKNNNDAKINYRKTKTEVNQITHDIVLLEDNVLFFPSTSCLLLRQVNFYVLFQYYAIN
jgi:hypothetical protein